MLRFPYLLSLLLCIELSFCYNYIDEVNERQTNNLERNLRRGKSRRARRPNVRKTPMRQEADYDRSPVEFDVASFIQADQENLLETDEAFVKKRTSNQRWSPKPFDLGTMLNTDDSNNKMENTPDYMSMGNLPELNMNPPLSKDLINAKHFGYNPLDELSAGKYGHEKFRNIYKDDLLLTQNDVHSHEKKCSSLKTLKFPFFSHNKSEPLKPKKTKKRKLFFFNNSKKETSKIDFNKMNDDTMIPYKIKRSYEQRLCPACKKLFLADLEHGRLKKNPTKMIHNSRQFYQNTLPGAPLKEDIKDIHTNKISYTNSGSRKKREQDRERQLKELEEVQRKIDSVEVRLPQFEKPAEKKIVYN